MLPLSIPNVLSLARLANVPVLLIVTFYESRYLFVGLLLLSYLSDVLDGAIARWTRSATQQGARLDSIADAGTSVAAVTGAFVFERSFLAAQYRVVTLLLALYLFQIVLALIKHGVLSSFHTWLGKLASVLLAVFVTSLLLLGPIVWLFHATAVIIALSLAEEIALVVMLRDPRTNVKGIFSVRNRRTL